jgi:hypothetical protein
MNRAIEHPAQCQSIHRTAVHGKTTLQQFRECVTGEEGYRFVIHDRDRIFSGELDQSLKSLGLTVLKTPYKSPQANAFCERLIGSARRECLDFMIPSTRPTFARRSSPGSFITTEDVLTPASARECRMRVLRRRNVGANGTKFRRTIALLRLRCSAGSIMNIAWSELRHEAICDQTDYLRRTGGKTSLVSHSILVTVRRKESQVMMPDHKSNRIVEIRIR